MGVVLRPVLPAVQAVVPLIIAHTILDVVAFVGYTLLKDHLGFL